MTFFTIAKVTELFLTYKYFLILPLSIIEGPIISIIGGSFVHMGYLDFTYLYLTVVLGDLIGDIIYYCIGRFGGLYFIKKWNNLFGVDTKKLVSLESTFKRHGPKILFAGKTQSLGVVILMAAGLAKYSFLRYMLYNTLATLIKSFILIYLGYVFGKQYSVAGDIVFKVGVVLSFAFVVLIYLYFRKQFSKNKIS